MNRNLTNQNYYQKTKLLRQAKYQHQKEKKQQLENEINIKYSQAENYQILMSLKEYTQLNKAKQQK